jgi:hypothetical protein
VGYLNARNANIFKAYPDQADTICLQLRVSIVGQTIM